MGVIIDPSTGKAAVPREDQEWIDPRKVTPKEPISRWDRLLAKGGAVMWGYRDLLVMSRVTRIQAAVGGSIVPGYVLAATTRRKRRPSKSQIDQIMEDFGVGAATVTENDDPTVMLVTPVDPDRRSWNFRHVLWHPAAEAA